MFIIKMKLEDADKKSIEWNLQGLNKQPLKFLDYGTAEREAHFVRQKHKEIEGFSCVVIEEKNA